MISKKSGIIYRFALDYQLGYAYAELLDFSDQRKLDGNLIYVFDAIGNLELEVSEVYQRNIFLGPLPVNTPPNVKGKGAWKYITKTSNLLIDSWPLFKAYHGIIADKQYWHHLDKWYIVNEVEGSSGIVYHDYEELRYLETLTLNTPKGIATKVTMKYLIDNSIAIDKYYDLTETVNRILYIQLVNTYYGKEKAESLLRVLRKEG